MNTNSQQPTSTENHPNTALPITQSITLLGKFAQEAFKFADDFYSAPDAISKLSILADLEEQLEDFKRLLEGERVPLEREHNQGVLTDLDQFAIERDYESVEHMLTALGLIPSTPVQNKVIDEPQFAAEFDAQCKVHPNPKRKVYKFLLNGDHKNYTLGHNGCFTGRKPAWATPYMIGKVIDNTKFHESTADEIAAMEALVQAELDSYKPRKANGAAALPKQ